MFRAVLNISVIKLWSAMTVMYRCGVRSPHGVRSTHNELERNRYKTFSLSCVIDFDLFIFLKCAGY